MEEDLDICCLTETHLNNTDDLSIPKYVTFRNDRTSVNNTTATHGGVAIVVKRKVLNQFTISITSSDVDGLLIIRLKDKRIGKVLDIACVYICPEGSKWCNSDEILEALTLYNYANCDSESFIILGDFNARTGQLPDFNVGVDNFEPRLNSDNKVNTLGKHLIDFVIENKFIMLNGHMKNSDKYTCYHTGKSVVDYIIVDQTSVNAFCEFNIIDVRNFTTKSGIQTLSDHCLLTCHLNVSYVDMEKVNVSQQIGRRYDYRHISGEFLCTQTWVTVRDGLIEKLLSIHKNQTELDAWYSNMIERIFVEMDTHLEFRDVDLTERKRFKYHKPYWNKELSQAWREYVKTNESDKKLYKSAQYKFNRLLQKTKRDYHAKLYTDIESANTKNPTEFWNFINKIGPSRKQNIPDIVEINGELYSDADIVINKWKEDFSNMYNKPECVKNDYDIEFGNKIMRDLKTMETKTVPKTDCERMLNGEIEIGEVSRALDKLKTGKAVGIDGIKNEVIKLASVHTLLTHLFNFCFKNSIVPTLWKTGIITPIPKSGMKNIYLPLEYRGLTLLSTLEKTYTSVLNARLTAYCDNQDLLHEEQAGFRKGYSCEDQVFLLHNIIKMNQNVNKSTFCAFLDLRKFFDWISRDLLFYKLLRSGISGKFYYALKSIYLCTTSKICVNQMTSEEFEIVSGLLQGETLSPKLASFYLNDLIDEINSKSSGVVLGDTAVKILLYADDIVLISTSTDDLQKQLNIVEDWCRKWQTSININKSKIVHFRRQRVARTDNVFKIFNEQLEVVSEYKYLGLYLDEFLNYEFGTDVLANSAQRALSKLIHKCKLNRDLGYSSYTKVYNSYVKTIIEYCASVWGHDSFFTVEGVTKRAIRSYLGVPRWTPLPFLYSEMLWLEHYFNTFQCKLRMYNRLIKMPLNRLQKKIFLHDVNMGGKSWYCDVIKICALLEYDLSVNQLELIDMEEVERKCWITQHNLLFNKRQQMQKLNLYNHVKHVTTLPSYLSTRMNKQKRSLLCNLMSGCLKLKIEEGRFNRIPRQSRLCQKCNQIEDEVYFLLHCTMYCVPRKIMLSHICTEGLSDYELIEKLYISSPCVLANYIYDAWKIRMNYN